MIGGGVLKRKCPICNKPLPEEAHFCLYCFHDFNEAEEIEDNNKIVKISLLKKLKQNKKALILIAVILILLLGVATACGIHYSGINTDNKTSQTENNQKHAVSEITNDDGSVITTYDDGSIETVKTDGTVITQEADGTVVTEKSDGTVITQKTDGTVVTEEPNGTIVTEKPDGTVITEKPDGTTVVTQKPTEATSENESTSGNTDEPSTETPSSDYSDIPINYDDFEFEYKGKYLYITKYTGKDKIVRVPYSYNGDYVYWIETFAFNSNSNIEKIIFEAPPDSAPPIVDSKAILYCSNLKSVVFNWNNIIPENNPNYLSIRNFASQCRSLTDIQVINCDKYKVYENGLYYYDKNKEGYVLYYLCEGANISEWHMPEWCVDVSSVCAKNSNIKRVYANPYSEYYLNKYCSRYLKALYIDDDNEFYFDDNGVVYNKVLKQLQFFSNVADIKEYTILDGYEFNPYAGLNGAEDVNANLEILHIPKNSGFNQNYLNKYFTSSKSNLKTIYIEEGHPNIDFINEYFKGEIIIY